MIIKVEFQSNEEIPLLIEQYSHLQLMEVQNITEGNFLIFTDKIEENLPSIEDRLTAVEDVANVLLGL